MDDLLDVPALRAELSVSQAQLAELLGLDQSTVSLWETGKTKPSGSARLLMQRLLADHRQDAAA